jgi:hypothetical protein
VAGQFKPDDGQENRRARLLFSLIEILQAVSFLLIYLLCQQACPVAIQR